MKGKNAFKRMILLKKIVRRGLVYFIRLFPNIFKGGEIELSSDEAGNYLSEIYPDISSSCLCENSLVQDPEYDLHIIVSAYNVQLYINQCIDSILNQKTRFKYYLTIVNDGSTDSTRSKLKQYESLSNVQIIDQSNKGYSGARNTALKNILGRYIMFVDSDDFLCESAIEILLTKGYEYKADIVQGSFNRVNERGETFEKLRLKEKQSIVPGNTEIMSQPWGKILKGSLFNNVKFPEGYWYEDTIIKFIIVSNSGLKVSIPNIVYNYRYHTGTVISQNKNQLKEIDSLYVTRSVLKDYLKNNDINEYILDHFLHQGKFIYNRMQYVRDEMVRKNVFTVFCDMYKKFLASSEIKSKKFPIIQQSLEERDYKLYCIGCKYYT